MLEFQAKIAAIREREGLSRRAFGELLGVPESKIQKIEIGAQRADHEFLSTLSKFVDVDFNWLFGKDHFTTGEPSVENTANSDFISIPRLSVQASAGPGALIDNESHSGSYAFNRKWLERRRLKPDNLSVIAVRGDSMEPMLTDGDLILVDRAQRQIADGLTYVLRIDDDLMVKMVQHSEPGMITLLSANKYYPPREINLKTSGDRVEIIGRVVASMQEW